MSEIVTISYTAKIQKIIFAYLLFDKIAFASYIEMFEPEFFDNKVLTDFMTIIKKYNKKYHKAPTNDEFKEEMLSFVATNKRTPTEEYIAVTLEIFNIGEKGDFDYVKDKIKDFAQKMGMKKAILDMGKTDLSKGDFDKAHSRLRKAENIGEIEENLGISLYGNEEKLRQRLNGRENLYDRELRAIKTGYPDLDSRMGGGICPPEIGVILGALKQGKTTVAINFAKGAVMTGVDVVYLSFESSEHSTADTFDAMVTGMPRKELVNRRPEVERVYKRFFDRPGIGQLQIQHMPAHSVSAQTIDSYLFRLEAQKGIKPKLLFADYLSLMRPGDKQIRYDGSSGGRYLLLGDIVLELAKLAHRRGIAIWILTQAQRGVRKKYAIKGRVGTDDTADSAEICRHADIVLSLNQHDDERDANPERLVLFAAACRNIEDKWEVPFNYHKKIAQIEEI